MSMPKEKIHFNLARYRIGDEIFEVVVDPDLAVAFREGKTSDISEVLKSRHVFSDAKKGLLAPESRIMQVFNTGDMDKAAETIIRQGEIQLTSEYREMMREEKRKRIIGIISRNGVDPKTHLPHPPQRIENAMREAKVRIDEFKSSEEQVSGIVNQLRPIIPISFETKELALRIPGQYAGKSYHVVSEFSRILKQEWQNDGSWVAVVELPGGMENDFNDRLNSICHGDFESKLLRTK